MVIQNGRLCQVLFPIRNMAHTLSLLLYIEYITEEIIPLEDEIHENAVVEVDDQSYNLFMNWFITKNLTIF